MCVFYIVHYVLTCTAHRNPLSFALHKCIYLYYYYYNILMEITDKNGIQINTFDLTQNGDKQDGNSSLVTTNK